MDFMGGEVAEGGEGVGICLICHSRNLEVSSAGLTIDVKKSSSPSILSRHLSVYFLLKHVLELPSEQLEKYLRHCPNPENWVIICSSCDQNYVEKCFKVFEELLEVKRRFAGVRLDLIKAVKRSLEAEYSQPHEIYNEDRSEFILDIDLETRRFVGQHEYFQPPERKTSTSGHFQRSRKSEELEIENERNVTRAISALPLELSNIQPGSLGGKQSISEIIPMECVECEVKEEPTSPKNDTGRMSPPNEEPVEEEALSWGEGDDRISEAGDRGLSESSDDDSNNGDDWNPGTRKKSFPRDEEVPREVQSSTSSTFSRRNDKGKKLFQCKICGKNLSQSYHLRRHIKTAHNSSKKQSHLLQFQLKCDLCPKTFPAKARLRKHQILIHKTNFYECRKCDWKSSSAYPFNLKAHMMRHHGTEEELKTLTCPKCGKTFGSKSYLDLHTSNCQSSKIVCAHCGKEFSSKSSHFNHLGAAHGIKDNLKFHCPVEGCGKSFYRQRELTFHKSTHMTPQHECSVCGMKFNRMFRLSRHMLSHKPGAEKAYQCDLCPASFARKDNLLTHMNKKVHSKEWKRINYKCSECELTFCLKPQVEGHLEKVHEGKGTVVTVRESTSEEAPTPKERVRKKRENFHCEHCGKEFKTKSKYLVHTDRVHGNRDDFKFVCTFEGCGKKFVVKSELRNHEDTHKDPSHKCEECGKMYCNLKGLKTHKRTVHRKKGEEIKKESFQCELCEVKVSSKHSLKKHVQSVHERKLEVCCDLCGKILQNRNYLKRHRARVHNIGIQDFPLVQCEICGKDAVSRGQLNRHIQAMHTNRESKPFKCEVCGKGFAIRDYLRLHMKTHEKKEPGNGSNDLFQV